MKFENMVEGGRFYSKSECIVLDDKCVEGTTVGYLASSPNVPYGKGDFTMDLKNEEKM